MPLMDKQTLSSLCKEFYTASLCLQETLSQYGVDTYIRNKNQPLQQSNYPHLVTLTDNGSCLYLNHDTLSNHLNAMGTLSAHEKLTITKETLPFCTAYLTLNTAISSIPALAHNQTGLLYHTPLGSDTHTTGYARLKSARLCPTGRLGRGLMTDHIISQTIIMQEKLIEAAQQSNHWTLESLSLYEVSYKTEKTQNLTQPVMAPSPQEALKVNEWIHWSLPIPRNIPRYVSDPDKGEILYIQNSI